MFITSIVSKLIHVFITFREIKILNEKFGKILVWIGSFAVILSIIVFIFFGSQIIWRDVGKLWKNKIEFQELNK